MNIEGLRGSEKDVLVFHLFFSVVCAAFLFVPLDMPVGIRLLILVVVYNILIPVIGLIRSHPEWIRLWRFAFFLSLFQVFPDRFLAEVLGVLVFPEDGCFTFGAVSGYMAGLWAIPLFLVIFIAGVIEERGFPKIAPWVAAAVALVIFGTSEETLWLLGSWYAQDVLMIDHAAVYILIPEMILGLAAFLMYRQVRRRSWLHALGGAFLTMLVYLGAAGLFYLLIEG